MLMRPNVSKDLSKESLMVTSATKPTKFFILEVVDHSFLARIFFFRQLKKDVFICKNKEIKSRV